MKCARFVLALLTLWSELDVSHSCSCVQAHPQTIYCTSDIVVLATPVKRIEDERTGLFQVAYLLSNVTVLKKTEKAKVPLKDSLIYTYSQSGLCGVTFQLDKHYVITGHVTNDRIETSLCGSYSELWDTTTPFERQGFQSLYRQGCSCNVDVCPYNEVCTSASDACSAHVDDFHCYRRHAACVPNSDGDCDWSIGKDFCRQTNNV